MSGKRRFLLDTNAVVSLLAGNRELAVQLESAEYVGISIISYLEFLASTVYPTAIAPALPASASGLQSCPWSMTTAD